MAAECHSEALVPTNQAGARFRLRILLLRLRHPQSIQALQKPVNRRYGSVTAARHYATRKKTNRYMQTLIVTTRG